MALRNFTSPRSRFFIGILASLSLTSSVMPSTCQFPKNKCLSIKLPGGPETPASVKNTGYRMLLVALGDYKPKTPF